MTSSPDPSEPTLGGAPESDVRPSVLEQMGGVSGLIYSTVPIVVFVPVNSAWGLTAAIVAALIAALAVFVIRLLRREPLNPAISGEVQLGAGLATVIRKGQAPTPPGEPGPGYTPLQASSSSVVASDTTDGQLFGEQSAGEELAASTDEGAFEQEALNLTNQVGQSVGVEEAFESGSETAAGLGDGLGSGSGGSANYALPPGPGRSNLEQMDP